MVEYKQALKVDLKLTDGPPTWEVRESTWAGQAALVSFRIKDCRLLCETKVGGTDGHRLLCRETVNVNRRSWQKTKDSLNQDSLVKTPYVPKTVTGLDFQVMSTPEAKGKREEEHFQQQHWQEPQEDSLQYAPSLIDPARREQLRGARAFLQETQDNWFLWNKHKNQQMVNQAEKELEIISLRSLLLLSSFPSSSCF